jgi:pimeloyl-ACP methyl ester carboxylesterase
VARVGVAYLNDQREAELSIWTELLFPVELLALHASPVFYGLGIPHGDGASVVLIPGLLCTDLYLAPLRCWLQRIGYNVFSSRIGRNADCPNVLIEERLNDVVEDAKRTSGRRVHLIGHSLGGLMARSVAARRPEQVASVITLGAPFRGVAAHRTVLAVIDGVRRHIVEEHGDDVLPDCYTGRCTCEFVRAVRRCLPPSVLETAIYTEQDGLVDWRYCCADNGKANFAVNSTHAGLSFNPLAYRIIANRLAEAES